MRGRRGSWWFVLLGLQSVLVSAQPTGDGGAVASGPDDDARRRQAFAVLEAYRSRCVAEGRCAATDAFALLPRSLRPWTRRHRGDGPGAWGPSPFAETSGDLDPSPSARAAAEAAVTVLTLDARRLDAPPPALDPGAAAPARRRWALRTLGPWIDAQVHELTVLTEEMREAREVHRSPDNAAPWAIVAERYAQLALRLDRAATALSPGDIAAIDAARGGPLPPPTVLLAWARDGFEACRSAAARAHRDDLRARCERGLAETDAAR